MDLSIPNKKDSLWVYIAAFIFIALNAVLIAKEFFYFSIIPFILAIVLLAIISLDRLILLIVFFVPLSIQLSDIMKGLEFDLYLPTEPLMIGVLLLVIIKYLYEMKFDKRVLYHPVSIAICLNLIWIFITSITSTMPLVSFKFLIARIWFLVTFYFLATQLFYRFRNVKIYIWMYIIPFLGVVFYSLTRHAGYGFFSQQAAHFVVQPFYNDHTSYGATLAFLIPVLIGFLIIEKKLGMFRKVLMWAVLIVFSIALVFSYTRAGWVSMAGALVIFIIIRLRIKFAYLAILGSVIIAFLYSQRTEIKIRLEQNRQTSSGDIAEHVKSISNVATDASNLERLNRWSCAWRMFRLKPVFGWGPGTYMFQYAPFQVSREKTEISTNAADLGNAHSEYIGPLAESGILGTLTFLAIVILAIITGLRVYYTSHVKEVKFLSLAVLLGLITYFLHGLLNNFLDTDKASALFWGYIAILVVMDIHHRNRESIEETKD